MPLKCLKIAKSNPNLPMIIAAASYAFLAVTGGGSLYYYYKSLVGSEFNHFALVTYTILFANGLCGFTEFLNEDSYCPLRELIDYFQVVLALPCYAAEIWTKNEVGPEYLATLHAGLGLLAAIIFVVMECQRKDLTDLAVFSNCLSLLGVGIIYTDPLAALASVVFVSGYVLLKRSDEQCCLAPQDKFNIVMGVFALISLASFDKDLQDKIKEYIPEAIKG